MIKRIDGHLHQESEYIHSPFHPDQVRDGDPVSARIQLNGEWLDARVWNYSPFGIEILDRDFGLSKGQELSLEIALGKTKRSLDGVTVDTVFEQNGRKVVGIRTFVSNVTKARSEERRQRERWTCDDSYLPTGTAPSPVKYNHYIHFRVDDISASGLRLITSMTNKLLIEGQRLDATLSLPLVGSVRALLKVVRTDSTVLNEKPFFVLGTEFINPDPILKASLAEYLLHFGQDISVERLKKQGFPVRSAKKSFDFSYAKTKEEFREVCELRLRAYQSAGKVKDSATVESMQDIFDERARILIVKHQGRVVGSVRIMFHEEADQLSYGRYFDTAPDNLPPRDQYAETSRMCTDPTYRGADIFYQLAEHMVLTTVKSGRRYLVGGATKELVPLWEKCGFRRIGVTYSSRDLGEIPHELIVMDAYAVALGKNVSRKLWSQSFSGLVNYVIDQQLVVPTQADRIRIGINRMLAKVLG